MICPKDGSACVDDLCRGSGCMAMDGYPMLEMCRVCGGLIDHENPSIGTCSCDDGDDDFHDSEEWAGGAA